MKNQSHKTFLFALIFYFALIIGFLTKLAIDISKKPVADSQSAIPLLAVEKLNYLVGQLEKRNDLGPIEKIDLSQFRFGKEEPFSP